MKLMGDGECWEGFPPGYWKFRSKLTPLVNWGLVNWGLVNWGLVNSGLVNSGFGIGDLLNR